MGIRKQITVVLVFLVLVLFSYSIGYSLGREKEAIYKELDIFAEGLALIEKKYVEDTAPEDLIYGAMRGMLISLDSYSQFLSPDEYKELLVDTEGEFGGIGIEITIKDGLLTIVSPIEGTPGWEGGLLPGDVIVKIDGELTKDINLQEAVKKLRGQPGTKVDLTVWREKTRATVEIPIVRGIIHIQDIKRALILEDNIAYIRIAEFRESTAIDLDKALRDLQKEGMKGIILDVRSNPGGLLYSAIEVASRFLPGGDVIVSTKSKTEDEKIFKALPSSVRITEIPMVVLIDQGSASGSEIVAAALRENKRAVLLGETTFGKGSVQTIIPLSDGSALRITTSKYYTPNGVSIHEKGIEPDISVPREIVEEVKEDVFENLEGKKKEFEYKEDSQILRALDLIRGLLVVKNKKK